MYDVLNATHPQSYSFMNGQRLTTTLYLYVESKYSLTQHNNSVLIKHIVIEHLAPKVTVGNHLYFEQGLLGRNTEKAHCWFCFSPSNRLTSNTQPAALYKI